MKDIKLGEDNDLEWVNDGQGSDLSYVESDVFCVIDILDAQKGEHRFSPEIGAFVQQYKLAKVNIQDIRKNIDMNLQADGWNKSSATATINTNGKVEISVDPRRNG
jgi:hypothetical protein